MDIRSRLGLNIRRLREKNGWSQEDYADRAGIHGPMSAALNVGSGTHNHRGGETCPAVQRECWHIAGPVNVVANDRTSWRLSFRPKQVYGLYNFAGLNFEILKAHSSFVGMYHDVLRS